MNSQQEKELLGRLDEISETLIKLETYLVESRISENLKSIAESLKSRE